MVVSQFDICLVNLDTVVSMDITKTRFCLILSPGEMIQSMNTILIAPMSTRVKKGPTRLPVTLEGKQGFIVLDQIRAIRKQRLIRRLGHLDEEAVSQVKSVLAEIFLL